MNLAPILVVGATGATGRHVVQQLLDQGRQVKVIVRSKQRMLELVKNADESNLIVTEASLLDLSDEELRKHVENTEGVISCLGHDGILAHPRRLVRDSVQRMSGAMMKCKGGQPKKFIIVGTIGVPNPAGIDDQRSLFERMLLSFFLYTLPPHADNEETAIYVDSLGKDSGIEWCIVRPTDLINGEVSEYTLCEKPKGRIFGDGIATRANVAKSMVDMLTDSKLWDQYKFKMPAIYDKGSN